MLRRRPLIKEATHRVAGADDLELHATVVRQIRQGAEVEFGVTIYSDEGAESARIAGAQKSLNRI